MFRLIRNYNAAVSFRYHIPLYRSWNLRENQILFV